VSEAPAPTAMHPVLGVLRAGVLLGLGWVAAAGLAWAAFGVLWAAPVLVLWLLLLRRFHGAMEALGRSIARDAAPRG